MNRIENGHYVFFPFDEYGEACVKRLVWEDMEYLYDHHVRKCLDEAIADLEGKIDEVQTEYGTVQVKRASGYGVVKEKLEYDDVSQIAEEHSWSVAEARNRIYGKL